MNTKNRVSTLLIISISFRQTVYFFSLLLIANICAGSFNMAHHYNGNFKDVIETAPALIWCSFIFWVSCQWRPKTNLRLYLLPGLHTLFWLIIVLDGIWFNNRMNSEDFLYANNELFFWWGSLKIITPAFRQYNVFAELFIVDIFAIAVGQLLLILSAIFIDKKIRR